MEYYSYKYAFVNISDLEDYKNQIVYNKLISYVSYNNDKIFGVISFRNVECHNHISGVVAIKFQENKENQHLFCKDIYRAFIDISQKYTYKIIQFSSSSDNIFCPTYEKIIKKYGGRVCGRFENNILNNDGSYSDKLTFEIKPSDILKHIKKY